MLHPTREDVAFPFQPYQQSVETVSVAYTSILRVSKSYTDSQVQHDESHCQSCSGGRVGRPYPGNLVFIFWLTKWVCRKEDYDRAKVLLNDAARSGSYLYPIKVGQTSSFSDAVSPGKAGNI
jgi:hypothetical protein